jgi:L-asparaginase/Glu-tRNA(Gln) amidotransferase subunit D
MTVATLVLAAAVVAAQGVARVAILATGGTIAGAGDASGYGYKAGAFKVEDLLKAVPKIGDLAELSGEQVASIGSQDMNDKGLVDPCRPHQRTARRRVYGLVIAGVGDGNMSQAALDALAAAVKSGVVVVRSTRLERGMVLRNNEVNDDKMGFVASGELDPPKSRVLLQLALMNTKDPARVQTIFDEY